MKYESYAGSTINEHAKEMARLALESNETVTSEFNEVPLSCSPGTSGESVVADYWAESNRRREEYLASPEYADQQKRLAEKDRQKRAAFEEAMKVAPERMTFAEGNEAEWQEFTENNGDPYGSAVVRYAELWARLMESRIARGETVEQCAKETSHIADTDGITGFMYGCAVVSLAQAWVHGEALRRWHNLETQIGHEGEKANETGGVLNPALLNIR